MVASPAGTADTSPRRRRAGDGIGLQRGTANRLRLALPPR